jgi:glycine/D-amino acid oxidase-like deaminating enzyme
VIDLAVVGAGVMGAWTAVQAIRAGRRVTLFDAHGAGHSRATSGDETRITRASHGPDEFYVRWSRAAREEWIALGDEIGQECFVQAGALWFAHRDDGFEAISVETLRRLGIPVERISPEEAVGRWPQIAVDDLAFVVFEPEAGLLMARRSVAGLAARVTDLGGSVEIAAVRPGDADGSRMLDIVLGDGRRIGADQFVFACGPWLPSLFPDIAGDLIRVTKQDVCFMGPAAGDTRFGASSLPCWIDYEASFYGVPAVDGRGMKIAPDEYGEPFDPSADDRLVDERSVRQAHAYLARRFPALAGAPVVETRVCQYETTPDTNFVIDRHPAFDNVWLVGGGSGHGFKHGPSIGRYVTRLLDGHVAEGPELRFRIDRPREVAATGAGARRIVDEAYTRQSSTGRATRS